MNSFEEVKIVGIDQERPPRVRKESYIDLFFNISQKAPLDWCEDFNALGRQINPSPKIDKTARNCIATYVSDMAKIPSHLSDIKQVVIDCNVQYMEKIRQKELALAASNAALEDQDGEQHRLNQIVSALEFDI
ncbi:MAG: hypothetical protein OES20_08805 [Gammaproteobacteria bacterium]|nr:hypothetical protein [Gammaproteobacteria bacterium]MDH3858053.1 hypothetical protein [Gammaproteobacteria bacterium]